MMNVKKKNVRILFLIVSKKHSLCLTFMYISAVVGLVLRRVIKKGQRCLPVFTSLCIYPKNTCPYVKNLCVYHRKTEINTMKHCATCCHQGGKWKHLFLWEPSPLMMQAKHTKHASKCADRHKRTLTHTNVLHHTNAHCQQFQHTCIEYIYENLYIACLRVTARQSTTERDGSEKKKSAWLPEPRPDG